MTKLKKIQAKRKPSKNDNFVQQYTSTVKRRGGPQSCPFHKCYKGFMDLPLVKRQKPSVRNHLFRYHEHDDFHIATKGTYFIFNRDPPSNFQYVCVCGNAFAAHYSLKTHITGKDKTEPCDKIQSFASSVTGPGEQNSMTYRKIPPDNPLANKDKSTRVTQQKDDSVNKQDNVNVEESEMQDDQEIEATQSVDVNDDDYTADTGTYLSLQEVEEITRRAVSHAVKEVIEAFTPFRKTTQAKSTVALSFTHLKKP